MLCYAKLLQPAYRLPSLPCAISRKCCIGREECTLGVGRGRVPERLYEVWIKSGEGARAVFETSSVMGICLSREAWSIVLGRHSELWSALLLCQSISTSSPVCAPPALSTHCPRSQKGDQMRYEYIMMRTGSAYERHIKVHKICDITVNVVWNACFPVPASLYSVTN